MCAVLHGVYNGLFKMAAWNFAFNRVLSFSQLFCLFWEKKCSSDQFSKYRYLLSLSATVKMDYEENMENARYAKNDDTSL